MWFPTIQLPSRNILQLACLVAIACSLQAAAAPEQREVDRRAFERAQKAATAETWTAALAVLQAIDVNKIEDVDVITYVDFSTRCANLAEELGVSRNSDPSNAGKILAEMDLPKFFSTLWSVIERKGLSGAAKLAVESRRLWKQISMYQELDAKLTRRYRDE
ncbi:MAG: hypothetical protein HZC55_18205 [Verrucomicrobia bacterium]|nr:hypothetical protein [Verrucomicrobiota bacterium]